MDRYIQRLLEAWAELRLACLDIVANRPKAIRFIHLGEPRSEVLVALAVLAGILVVGFPEAPDSSQPAKGSRDTPLLDYASAEMAEMGGLEGPVYAHSLIPGGAFTIASFRQHVERDALLAGSMAGCDWQSAREFSLDPVPAVQRPVSYRVGGKIFWTRRAVRLFKKEPAITVHCGKDVRWFLERCGNEVRTSRRPRHPLGDLPPTTFEYPELPPATPTFVGKTPEPPTLAELPPGMETPPTGWFPPGGPGPSPPVGRTGAEIYAPCCIYGVIGGPRGGGDQPTPSAAAPEPGNFAAVLLLAGAAATMAWKQRRHGRESREDQSL